MKRSLAWTLAALCSPTWVAPAIAAPAALARRAQSTDELLAAGRKLLAEGRVDEAVATFERAVAADGGTPKSRLWLVRGWIAQSKFDDALVEIDELRAAGLGASDAQYLFGLAFLGMAKSSAASGGNQYTQSQFDDAFANLQAALDADGERYADAWLPLAEAAWYAQDLEVARNAANEATVRAPQDPQAHAMAGRVQFSLYVAADESAKEQHWSAALAAFEKATALYGKPGTAAGRSQLAEVLVQCGNLHAWKESKAAAAACYSEAMGWDPSLVDFVRVRDLLGEGFLECLSKGVAKFESRHSAREPLYATLAWWHGFALFGDAQWDASEAAFRTAVGLWPGYANSWFYIARCCYSQQRQADAIAALHANLQADPEALVASIAADPGRNLGFIAGLLDWCVDPQKHGGLPDNENAAFLCEILTRVEPAVARHWNNLGLFLRDQGDALRIQKGKQADEAELRRLWQAAFDAYQRSLELEPGDPNYLNDTAVMLHYYLKRDYEQARALYEKAAQRAEQELARKDLTAEARGIIQIAKRDANNNLAKLERLMEKLARGEQPGAEDENN